MLSRDHNKLIFCLVTINPFIILDSINADFPPFIPQPNRDTKIHMLVKPPCPEGDSQTTYKLMDSLITRFFHLQ